MFKQKNKKPTFKLSSLPFFIMVLNYPIWSVQQVEGEVWKSSRPTQSITYYQTHIKESEHKNYEEHKDVGLYSELSDDDEDYQSVITREPNRVVITFSPVPTIEKEKTHNKPDPQNSFQTLMGSSQVPNEKPAILHSSSYEGEDKSQTKEKDTKRERGTDSAGDKKESDSADNQEQDVKKNKTEQEGKKKADDNPVTPVTTTGTEHDTTNASKTLSKSSTPTAEMVVKNKDNREAVRNPICLTYPWCVHGRMKMKFKHKTSKKKISYIGSGTMIGEKFVVTAAHNLFFRNSTTTEIAHRQQWEPYPYKILFYPGMDGTKGIKPLEALAKKAFITPEWEDISAEKSKADEYDFGLLVLDKELGHQTGWYGGYIANDNDLQTFNLNITGYPGDLPKKHDLPHPQYAGKVMYTASGIIHGFSPIPNEHHVYYSIATAGGQSGSALWTEKSSNNYYLGVHTTGSSEWNRSVRLTQGKLTLLNQWMKNVREETK